jgi:hypothetical protein
MVIKLETEHNIFDVFYGSENLEVVRPFTYLGVTLSSNGIFIKQISLVIKF